MRFYRRFCTVRCVRCRQSDKHQEQGLLEGHRCGRPAGLTPHQRQQLQDILDSGPLAYGFETGIWTSPVIRRVIEEEFGVKYHPGHVRRLLKQLGYSVQRPTTRLVQAHEAQKRKRVRYTYPTLKKRVAGRGADRFHRRSFIPADTDAACYLGSRCEPTAHSDPR